MRLEISLFKSNIDAFYSNHIKCNSKGSCFMYSTSMLLFEYQTVVCTPHTHTHMRAHTHIHTHTHTHTLVACEQMAHCAFISRRHHSAHKSHGLDVMLRTTLFLVVVTCENKHTHTHTHKNRVIATVIFVKVQTPYGQQDVFAVALKTEAFIRRV